MAAIHATHSCLRDVPPEQVSTLAHTRPQPAASPLVRQPARGARDNVTAANMLGLRSLEISPVFKSPLVRRGSDEASSAHMLASPGAVAPRSMHSGSAALRRALCPADSIATRLARWAHHSRPSRAAHVALHPRRAPTFPHLLALRPAPCARCPLCTARNLRALCILRASSTARTAPCARSPRYARRPRRPPRRVGDD
jgi:hypothetical protein